MVDDQPSSPMIGEVRWECHRMHRHGDEVIVNRDRNSRDRQDLWPDAVRAVAPIRCCRCGTDDVR